MGTTKRATTKRGAPRPAVRGATARRSPATRAPAARKPAPPAPRAGRAAKPAAARPSVPATAPGGRIGAVHQHMGYTSHALEDVRRFYTDLLGFTDVQHDPQRNYVWVRTGPSSSLGFTPPMPGPPEDWRPPREPLLYFLVADVDRAYRDLLARGAIFTQPPTDMPWNHRVATLKDPEGRSVSLATPIDG